MELCQKSGNSSQQVGQPQGESIAESHIRANVPDEKDFDKFLKRDLEQYFKDTLQKTVTVESELLRKGPTQTGIAYPKFYAWVTIRDGGKLVEQGAVRVAAVEKNTLMSPTSSARRILRTRL